MARLVRHFFPRGPRTSNCLLTPSDTTLRLKMVPVSKTRASFFGREGQSIAVEMATYALTDGVDDHFVAVVSPDGL
jgi:hypothetical protein